MTRDRKSKTRARQLSYASGLPIAQASNASKWLDDEAVHVDQCCLSILELFAFRDVHRIPVLPHIPELDVSSDLSAASPPFLTSRLPAVWSETLTIRLDALGGTLRGRTAATGVNGGVSLVAARDRVEAIFADPHGLIQPDFRSSCARLLGRSTQSSWTSSSRDHRRWYEGMRVRGGDPVLRLIVFPSSRLTNAVRLGTDVVLVPLLEGDS